MKKRKSSLKIIIVAIIILAVAVGMYFLFSGPKPLLAPNTDVKVKVGNAFLP